MIRNAPFVLFACLLVQFTLFLMARGGETDMSTSDFDPLYPASGWNKNTEVVVGSISHQTSVTTTVTLTTYSNDGGPVFVTYTPSSGVIQTSDTGWGTQNETGTFSFLSTCIGVQNSIALSVSHYDTDDITICSTDVPTSFTICIPASSVAVDGTVTNTFNGFSFSDNVSVAGIDDLSQLQITQTINAVDTEKNTVDDSDFNVGTGVPYNTGGRFLTDTGWQLQDIASVPIGDTQVLTLRTSGPVIVPGGGGTNYLASYIGYCERDFHTELTRKVDGAQVAEFDWGYQWDNYNDTWPAPAGAPSGYQYYSYGGVQGAPTPTSGEFYSIYGITGL